MLLLYFVFFKGFSSFFMQAVSPFYICFFPQTFFCKTNSVIFVFSFLVVNLIVSFSFIERLHSFVHLLLVHA